MKLTTDKAIISAQIKSICNRGASLDLSIWETACNCVAHAQEHGDVTLFGNLVMAMPKGSRVKTLIDWVQTSAPITVELKTGKAGIDKARVKAGEFESDRSDWGMDFLTSSPWYDYKKSPDQVEFDLKALRAYLTKLAEGKRKNATEGAMDAATACLHALEELTETETETA